MAPNHQTKIISYNDILHKNAYTCVGQTEFKSKVEHLISDIGHEIKIVPRLCLLK